MKGCSMDTIGDLFVLSGWCFIFVLALIKITDPAPEKVGLFLAIILVLTSLSTVILSFVKIFG